MVGVEDLRYFGAAELATGGPDPQVRLVAEATRRLDVDPDWAAGCFVATYTCAGGAAIWGTWSAEQALTYPAELERWLRDHWAGVPVRRERRAVWRADKLATSLVSYARWAHDRLPALREAPYVDLYDAIDAEVAFFGRYAAMKVLETLHLAGRVAASQVDIRPRGAWSPRKTLALLYEPAHAYRSDAPLDLAEAHELAKHAHDALDGRATWFQVETLLCNFRQALDGKYPGRSHDRELGHWLKAEAHWGPQLRDWLPFYDLRRELFPAHCLGEVGGWRGARGALEEQWRSHYAGRVQALPEREKRARSSEAGSSASRRRVPGTWQVRDRLLVSKTPTVDVLERVGATAVISLSRKGVEAEAVGDRWHWHVPIPDGRRVDAALVESIAQTAAGLHVVGHTVVLHCLAGRNRSALVAALVLRRLEGLTGEAALEEVRRLRPRALANPVFEELLRGLDAP